MSIPSSSDEVATRHGIRPAFRSSSICVRCSRASEPWCARAISSSASFVQPEREPLGEAAVVDEDDRRAVRADELDERRVDRRPDRARLPALPPCCHHPARACRRRGRRPRGRAPSRRRRRRARSAGRRETKRPISSSGRCVADRPIRWSGCAASASSRSTREREMGAALRPGDGVHLVEDQRVDAAQQLARRDVSSRKSDSGVVIRMSGGVAEHRRALLLRRVARAHGDAELRAEPGERPAEVPLDVVVERLERRDVQARGARVPASARQPVDRREERRERLPRAGRRLDEDVSRRSRSPASPAPARASARRSSARTRPASRAEGRRARASVLEPSAAIMRSCRAS